MGVTVIIACFNHEVYVQQAIQSVLAQSYKPVQLIVIDDASADGSVNKIEEIHTPDSFMFLQNENNIGLNGSILRALEFACGDFVSVLASDDYLAPGKLGMQADYLRRSGKEGVYASAFTVQGDRVNAVKMNPVFKTGSREKILAYIYCHDWGGPLLQSGLFSRKMFSEMIPLRKKYKSDDWAFMISAYESYDIGYLDEPLFFYRLHGSNTHKKYWFTFPMRIDIISGLVPEKFRTKALGNMLLSQGQYHIADGKFRKGTRLFCSALFLNFSGAGVLTVCKSYAASLRNVFTGIKN